MHVTPLPPLNTGPPCRGLKPLSPPMHVTPLPPLDPPPRPAEGLDLGGLDWMSELLSLSPEQVGCRHMAWGSGVRG